LYVQVAYLGRRLEKSIKIQIKADDPRGNCHRLVGGRLVESDLIRIRIDLESVERFDANVDVFGETLDDSEAF